MCVFQDIVDRVQSKLKGGRPNSGPKLVEQLKSHPSYNLCPFRPFPASKSLKLCAINWMPLLDPFGGGMILVLENYTW